MRMRRGPAGRARLRVVRQFGLSGPTFLGLHSRTDALPDCGRCQRTTCIASGPGRALAVPCRLGYRGADQVAAGGGPAGRIPCTVGTGSVTATFTDRGLRARRPIRVRESGPPGSRRMRTALTCAIGLGLAGAAVVALGHATGQPPAPVPPPNPDSQY